MCKERGKIFCLLLAALCSPVSSDVWKATVVNSIDAVVSSCTVVPCSFSHTGGNLPNSRLRGIWHHKGAKEKRIYHEDRSMILDNFKDRTKLLDDLGQSNCTLEITDIKNHDNGPFCFRVELVREEDNKPTKDMFSFVEDCVNVNMLPNPPAPQLIHLKTATQGRPFTVTCSVIHTCPSHPPKITWSWQATDTIIEHHKDIQFGNWETQSILSFVPEEKDDHSELKCTVQFNGGKTSYKTLTLYVKRSESYNHIIIPTVVGICTAAIFGIVCIFMAKKYKNRIAELENPDGSIWRRLSRLSHRIRSDGPRPSRSDQRRTIWSRFSRRPKGDRVDFGHLPNNMHSNSSAEQKVSKPRFPSPKSIPKSCNYNEDPEGDDLHINTAEFSIYGNI
ncbi:sialic acid-binding Ig-like lectin 9 [Pholidichthys leucotaenia]